MKKHIITLTLGLSLSSTSIFATENVSTIGHKCLQQEFTHDTVKCIKKAHKAFQNQKIEQIGDTLNKIEADLKSILND